MSAQCWSPVKGKVIRVTKVGACGEPIFDPTDVTWPVHAVYKCFSEIAYEPEIDDGEEINELDANGDACVSVPPCPKIKWFNVTVTLKRVDPELFSLFTGVPVVLDATGAATGFRIPRQVNCDSGVALESWTGTSSEKRCIGSGVPRAHFGYFLVPLLTNAIVQNFSIVNGLAAFQIKGKGVHGGSWGTGPYPIYETATGGVAALSEPIGVEDLLHADVTTLTPPTPGCGILPRPPDATLTTAALVATLRMTHIPAGPPPHPSTVFWGDGTNAPAPTVLGAPGINHTYASAGTYQVRIVDDVTGATRLKTVTVA